MHLSIRRPGSALALSNGDALSSTPHPQQRSGKSVNTVSGRRGIMAALPFGAEMAGMRRAW
jgi:hypothetical protein